MSLDRNAHDYKILLKTIYGEAKDEPEVVQRAIAWTVKNRADFTKEKWGGPTLAAVCTHPGEYHCWDNGDFEMYDIQAMLKIDKWLPSVYQSPDPTSGATHYLRIHRKMEYPDWATDSAKLEKFENHQFYTCK